MDIRRGFLIRNARKAIRQRVQMQGAEGAVVDAGYEIGGQAGLAVPRPHQDPCPDRRWYTARVGVWHRMNPLGRTRRRFEAAYDWALLCAIDWGEQQRIDGWDLMAAGRRAVTLLPGGVRRPQPSTPAIHLQGIKPELRMLTPREEAELGAAWNRLDSKNYVYWDEEAKGNGLWVVPRVTGDGRRYIDDRRKQHSTLTRGERWTLRLNVVGLIIALILGVLGIVL